VLTWTLFALMQQPDVERKLLAELDAEVGNAAVSAPLPRAGRAPAAGGPRAAGQRLTGSCLRPTMLRKPCAGAGRLPVAAPCLSAA